MLFLYECHAKIIRYDSSHSQCAYTLFQPAQHHFLREAMSWESSSEEMMVHLGLKYNSKSKKSNKKRVKAFPSEMSEDSKVSRVHSTPLQNWNLAYAEI